MKRTFVLGATLCLSVAMAGAAMAAGRGSNSAAAPPMAATTPVAGATFTTGATATVGTTGQLGVTGRVTTGAFSPSNVPPVVPRGATTVSTTTSGTSTIVTYQLGSTFYHVTYLLGGRYTYTISRSALTTGVAGTSVTGGTTALPRTGGGRAPSTPWVPVLVGMALAGMGVLVRRAAVRPS